MRDLEGLVRLPVEVGVEGGIDGEVSREESKQGDRAYAQEEATAK
jgi:hypothetical protein